MTGNSEEYYSKVTRTATGAVAGKYHTFIQPHEIKKGELKAATSLCQYVSEITNIIFILGNTATHFTLQPL
jgi:hypothetical protein